MIAARQAKQTASAAEPATIDRWAPTPDGNLPQTKEVIMRPHAIPPAILCILAASSVFAADRFFGFNETTSMVFTGVYLAPEGTTAWGPNEALNDKDKAWDSGERLAIKGVSRGKFDLKVVDQSGRVCIKHGLDLTKDTTFDVRDQDFAGCKK
jgi:hypothetical protein